MSRPRSNKLSFALPAAALFASAPLLIVVMAIFPFVNHITAEGLPENLSLAQYKSRLTVHYILDTCFILLFLIGWTGVARLAWENSKPLSLLTFGFAAGGKLLDFIENSLFWTQVPVAAQGDAAWLPLWTFISHLSWTLPFGAVVAAGAGLWGGAVFQKAVAAAGILFMVPAAVSLYYPPAGMVMGAWACLWFVSVSVLLWKSASPDPAWRRRNKRRIEARFAKS